MEASAQRLDGTLFKKVNDYGNCPICNVPFGNNIANHICGMKHCKNVRYAVNFTMPRSSAEQMTSTLCPHTRISGLPRLLRMVYWRRGRPHRRRGRCGQRRRPPRQQVPPPVATAPEPNRRSRTRVAALTSRCRKDNVLGGPGEKRRGGERRHLCCCVGRPCGDEATSRRGRFTKPPWARCWMRPPATCQKQFAFKQPHRRSRAAVAEATGPALNQAQHFGPSPLHLAVR